MARKQDVLVLFVGGGDEVTEASTALAESTPRMAIERVADGAAARTVIRERPVDCVVAAEDLPDGTGVELLDAVRADHAALPFVLAPADGDERLASEAVARGVSEYVPVDEGYDRLVERVCAVVDDGEGERDRRAGRVDRLARRYEAIFENPLTLIGLLDTDGTVLAVNRTALDMPGATLEEVVGHPFPETPWWRQDEALQEDLRSWIDRAADGEYVRYEATHPTDEGEPATVDGLIHPVEDEQGRVKELVAVARDVTAREERRRTIEELHAVATELTTYEDRQDVAERMVEAAESVLDLDLSAIALEEDGKLPPTAASDGIPEDGLTTFHPDEGLTGKTYRTGESFLVEDLSTVPEADPQGAYESAISVPVGGHGTFQAIAREPAAFDEADLEFAEMLAAHAESVLDRIDRQREVEAVRDRLQFVLESTNSLAWVIDVEAEALSALYGPTGELYGVDAGGPVPFDVFIETSVHPEDRARLEEIRHEIFAGEKTRFDVEYRPHPEADAVDWVATTGTRPSPDADEVFGLTTDVSELKRRELELASKNERLEEFAAVLSHDLRGPLTVANGHLEMLEEEFDSEHLEEIARSHERMEALIRDVLVLVREGKGAVETAPVDFASVVERCWEATGDADASLVVDGTAMVSADSGRLKQLLENLLRNAVEHGGTDVTVRVGTLSGGDGFYVADDGPGIPVDERDRVFESGYTTADDGTGFGLNIVQRVADAHGWTVAVADSEEGGARFEVHGVERA